MSNAIEDALGRANAQQREKAQQAIEEAQRNIKLVSMHDEITPTDTNSITKNVQIIEEAKGRILFDTMKDVISVSSPLPIPSKTGNYHSNVVKLHPRPQSTVEHIEQGEGKNYLRENAVDRAGTRQTHEAQGDEQQQAIAR